MLVVRVRSHLDLRGREVGEDDLARGDLAEEVVAARDLRVVAAQDDVIDDRAEEAERELGGTC